MKLLFTIFICCVTLIFSVKTKAQIITTVAGNGTSGYAGDSGPAVNAELNQPIDVDVDAAGNIYIVDGNNNVIRKVNAKTGIITTIAGNGTQGFSGDSGLATKAQLNRPFNIVLDKNDNIYINDVGNERIRKVNAKKGVIKTIAGNGSTDHTGDSAIAIDAAIFPLGMAFDKTRTNLYFTESIGGGRIRKINLTTGILSTVFNPNFSYYGYELVLDSANNIYMTCDDYRIRRIDGVTKEVTIVAGNGIVGFSGDGDSAIKAEFSFPQEVAFDASNNFYIADRGNARLRKINYADSIISTIAGNGISVYNGDGIPPIDAQLSLWGIKIDAQGNIYIADIDNNRIRKITSQILPVNLISFTAQKQNSLSFLQWQTTNEINNNYFDVERSSNTKTFSSIGTKQGLNNAGINNYSFTDNAPLEGVNYYRLKQVDKEGASTYSGIASVEFLNDGAFAITPNPASGNVTITIPASNSVSAILFYDVSGKKILHEEVAPNITSKQINVSNLTAGVYNVVLIQNGKYQMIKLVKR